MINLSIRKNKKKQSLVSTENNQFLERGLYIREDDQDWGSAGMNDIQKDSDKSQ